LPQALAVWHIFFNFLHFLLLCICLLTIYVYNWLTFLCQKIITTVSRISYSIRVFLLWLMRMWLVLKHTVF
jgi:hypothetical protein